MSAIPEVTQRAELLETEAAGMLQRAKNFRENAERLTSAAETMFRSAGVLRDAIGVLKESDKLVPLASEIPEAEIVEDKVEEDETKEEPPQSTLSKEEKFVPRKRRINGSGARQRRVEKKAAQSTLQEDAPQTDQPATNEVQDDGVEVVAEIEPVALEPAPKPTSREQKPRKEIGPAQVTNSYDKRPGRTYAEKMGSTPF